MLKIISLVLVIISLNACDAIEFKKGAHHIEPIKYRYDKKTQEIIINTSKNNNIYLEFFSRMCGAYGLWGVIIPIVPYWETQDCSRFKVSISAVDKIEINHHGVVYKDYEFDSKYQNYTFPINTKSLSDGAVLIIEKDGETFEIPFRYQHTFDFELWGV